jgi:chemotaxis protein histidine kinase CheA
MSDSIINVPRDQHDLHVRSASLLSQLLADPRTAEDAERLVQTINPEAKFPARERREAILAPVMDELSKERKAREALEAKMAAREEREAEAERNSKEQAILDRLNSVKAKRGFSDEMMEKVISRMREQNNPDVDAAAAYVSESIPKAPPATPYADLLPSNVDPYGSVSGDERWAALHKDPNRWLSDEIRAIAKDPEFARLGQVA